MARDQSQVVWELKPVRRHEGVARLSLALVGGSLGGSGGWARVNSGFGISSTPSHRVSPVWPSLTGRACLGRLDSPG
jgi:hypothetical protein